MIGKLTVAVGVVALGSLAAAQTAPEDVGFTADGRVTAPLVEGGGDGYRGVQLFMDAEKTNCLGCHENYDTAATGRAGDVGPDLSLVGDKHAESWFRALLVDSHKVFGEDTAMPRFYVADPETGETALTAQEVEDLVAYLMELHQFGN